ncbi:hypothetical protein CANINC_000795 [Pichia inconspicua]|uniref:Hsp70 nucleotide exchange factor FES1 n=1 Tax=Pichia inconspicua TaxID=52247 RepID=A0A4V4NG52_9ASCO|nr:hypothetical protein CANINC_000795 [[Candida] inconspicua]
MEKLLQWSTAQQSDDPEVRSRAPAPDPKILAQVLGANTGKDESTLMKEDISVLVCDDPRITVDDKLTALEDFEMLVQNLDNANNISPMGIWPEIAKLYTYEGEEQDEFRGLGALITGTAVQNNTKCQNDFLKNVGSKGIKDLLELSKSGAKNTRARALYALSGLVAHNGEIYKLFVDVNGWEFLTSILSQNFEDNREDRKLLLRCLGLLKSLIYDEITEENKEATSSRADRFELVNKFDLVNIIAKYLFNDVHFDIKERVANILGYLSQHGYKFTESESDNVKKNLATTDKESINQEDYKHLSQFL